MTRRALADPYLAVIRRFNRLGIRYVVIGMSGINYYAQGPSETIVTMDYDVFIEPTLRNVQRAVRGLAALGFSVSTSAGAVPDDLRPVLRARRTLMATTPEGFVVELLLQVSGFRFDGLAQDAKAFVVHGVLVRVGRLEKLLASKRAAGRPKDRGFLQRYRRAPDVS